ncbi:MAG: hypothetical protein KatS3mg110_3480 [Pirellulaceae bacterium]|nr:MAG: hypothetical protein KatS3mg110_3480 [Pirellulaceae bacterium]
MFELDEIRRVVELHEKSYRLLRWVGSALETGTVTFNYVHVAMSASDAAKEWLRRHFANIPGDLRPNEDDIDAFAKLFSSYLTTSFELHENPKTILKSRCGCYCSWCAYLGAGAYLKTKKITKKSRKDADQLKTIYLRQLASTAGLNMSPPELLALAHEPDCSYNVSLATYAWELVRRTKFASQGEGILVLWREIAWIENRPRKNFRLEPDKIIAAEQQIMERIKAGKYIDAL